MGSMNIAGGALPSLTTDTIGSVISTGLGAFNRAQQQQSAVEQLQARQQLENREAQERADRERQELALQQQEREAERRAALKRAVARNEASAGARGITSDGGSSEAILLGLFEESEAEKQRKSELDRIRRRAIDDREQSVRRRNLLELNAQKSRQNDLSFFV